MYNRGIINTKMFGGLAMKKFLYGLLVGLLLSIGITAFAAEQLTAYRASFPILVNGKEWKTDKPVVTIDGSTYLPLRALGEALGVKIEWNSKLKRVEIGETPTTGYSYSNPAPINTAQVIQVDNILQKYKVEMSVKDIIRGEEAWQLVKDANKFNDPAPEGYEYLLAKINFKLLDINEGEQYNLNGNVDITMVSSDGKDYDFAYAVAPEPELDAKLYKGASTEGWGVYLVRKDDAKPKLVFGRDYKGSGGIWFKAYK